MSWEHGTYGWETYETFVRALREAGVSYREVLTDVGYVRGWDGNCMCSTQQCEHWQQLRHATFVITDWRNGQLVNICKVVEEYLRVHDLHCDGRSLVDIAVYEFGHRPDLSPQVLLPR